MTRRKEGLILAIWANSNYDGQEVDRGKIVESLEDHFRTAIAELYRRPGEKSEWELEKEMMANNPFYSAMNSLAAEPKIETGIPDTTLLAATDGQGGTEWL
jgi:hypothetical protein